MADNYFLRKTVIDRLFAEWLLKRTNQNEQSPWKRRRTDFDHSGTHGPKSQQILDAISVSGVDWLAFADLERSRQGASIAFRRQKTATRWADRREADLLAQELFPINGRCDGFQQLNRQGGQGTES